MRRQSQRPLYQLVHNVADRHAVGDARVVLLHGGAQSHSHRLQRERFGHLHRLHESGLDVEEAVKRSATAAMSREKDRTGSNAARE